mmetsp:Transcript_8251/g.17456  ORF Transcript_8251/g.17456 Transcript_8251/m.17456 type:complete len:234 (-) Transcript_8251:44-745(-)
MKVKMMSDKSDNFDHVFSGFSVWLEPCPFEADSLINEMDYLADKCGGKSAGLHGFVPHCTLLYNIPEEYCSPDPSISGDVEQMGHNLLERCLHRFKEEWKGGESRRDSSRIELTPESFYYFDYPKTADDGRGFGCVISLLMIANTPQLRLVHDAAVSTFPPDERHAEAKGKFIPHMALVYAPENKAQYLSERTNQMGHEKRHLLKPLRARYLSLWSTRGQVKDWYRVAKVQLP